MSHYDLTPPKRAQAVKRGAIEVDRDKAVAIWMREGELRPGYPGYKKKEQEENHGTDETTNQA